MSEIGYYQNPDWLCIHKKIHHRCAECWPMLQVRPADATTASIDALRQALVSRNGLLESTSEQIRLNHEELTAKANAAAARMENLLSHQTANEMQIALARDLHLGQMEELRNLVSSGKQHIINTLQNSHDTFRVELKEGFEAIQQQIKETQALIAVTAETRRRAAKRKCTRTKNKH